MRTHLERTDDWADAAPRIESAEGTSDPSTRRGRWIRGTSSLITTANGAFYDDRIHLHTKCGRRTDG
jgi:hypothetical protein